MQRREQGGSLWGRRLLALSALAFAALTGCSRAVVTTEVQKDGTWKRTLKFYANAPAKDGPALGETLDSTFVLTKGEGWKTSRAQEKDPDKAKEQNPFAGGMAGASEVYTAERTLGVGESIDHDVALKSGDAKVKDPIVVNTVSVKEVAPGRFEYREILRWKGPKTPASTLEGLPIVDVKMMAEMKKFLPADLATAEKIQTLTRHLEQGVWQLMFGPNDPLLADIFKLMMFPDLLLPKMTRSFNRIFDSALAKTYGEALTAEERRAITRKMTESQVNQLKKQASEKAAAGPPNPNEKNKDGSFVALTYTVKMPGRITEANGEIDPVMNEVYWTFYSPAPMMGDVELRAVCDMNPEK
jgi:hypothetical protein